MKRRIAFISLMTLYAVYSVWIYTRGTDTVLPMDKKQAKGKQIFEEHNCQSCHQLFGLGGYLGPELTTVISDHGSLYPAALLKSGSGRMPDFHFSPPQIEAIIAYLTYVDQCATTYKNTGTHPGS